MIRVNANDDCDLVSVEIDLEELGSLEGGKSTASVRDCWFSKCGKKAVVRRPARRVKCEGDRKTERKEEGDREENLKGNWRS